MLSKYLIKAFSFRHFVGAKWHTVTRPFRLKMRGSEDFSHILMERSLTDSPQVTQGMWQAYGQMRAARTLARGTIAATGVAGVALWLYQQTLSQQKRTIEEQQKKLDFATRGFLEIDQTLQTSQQEVSKLIKELEIVKQDAAESLAEEERILNALNERLRKEELEIGSLEQNIEELGDARTFSQLQADIIIRLEKKVGNVADEIRQVLDQALNTPDAPNHQEVVGAYMRDPTTKALFDLYGVALRENPSPPPIHVSPPAPG